MSGKTDLREIVARALWRDRFRLREWDHAKAYLKATTYRKAEEAIKRAGVKNIEVPLVEEPFVLVDKKEK